LLRSRFSVNHSKSTPSACRARTVDVFVMQVPSGHSLRKVMYTSLGPVKKTRIALRLASFEGKRMISIWLRGRAGTASGWAAGGQGGAGVRIRTTGDLQWFFPFAGGESLLCIFEQRDKKTSPPIIKHRFEMQRPKMKQRKVILEDYHMDLAVGIFPSPDDKLVAIPCWDSKEKERILVIDAQGEIIADVARDK
jgi:hypothetical protein